MLTNRGGECNTKRKNNSSTGACADSGGLGTAGFGSPVDRAWPRRGLGPPLTAGSRIPRGSPQPRSRGFARCGFSRLKPYGAKPRQRGSRGGSAWRTRRTTAGLDRGAAKPRQRGSKPPETVPAPLQNRRVRRFERGTPRARLPEPLPTRRRTASVASGGCPTVSYR